MSPKPNNNNNNNDRNDEIKILRLRSIFDVKEFSKTIQKSDSRKRRLKSWISDASSSITSSTSDATQIDIDILAELLYRAPTKAANLCYTNNLQLPKWASNRSEFYSDVLRDILHLISKIGSTETQIALHNKSIQLLQLLLQKLAKGACFEAVNVTLHRMHADANTSILFIQLRNDVMNDLLSSIGPRNMARLLNVAFTFTPHQAQAHTHTHTHNYPSIHAAFLPLLKKDEALRDQVLKCIVLSSSSSRNSSSFDFDSNRRRIIACTAHLLLVCSCCEDGLVIQSSSMIIAQVAKYWCEQIFVQRTNGALQRQVTHFLLLGLKLLVADSSMMTTNSVSDKTRVLDDVTNVNVNVINPSLLSSLVKGVTCRLNSSIDNVRKDGMRIAEAFAPLVVDTTTTSSSSSSSSNNKVVKLFEELNDDERDREEDVLSLWWQELDKVLLLEDDDADASNEKAADHPEVHDAGSATQSFRLEDEDTEGKHKHREKRTKKKKKQKQKQKQKKKQPHTVHDILQIDPDAEYQSDHSDYGSSCCCEDESSSNDEDEQHQHDRLLTFTAAIEDHETNGQKGEEESTSSSTTTISNNSFDEDDLQPWTSALHENDDEVDLLPIQPPRYLRECLTLLRAPKDEEHAYTKHEQALKQLIPILCSSSSSSKNKLNDAAPPLDLQDVCTPLLHELVHMENAFDMERFDEMRLDALRCLAVLCPRSSVECLGGNVLFDGVSLGTRMEVLDVLVFVAEELRGGVGVGKSSSSISISKGVQQRLLLEEQQIIQDAINIQPPRGATSGKRHLVSDAQHYTSIKGNNNNKQHKSPSALSSSLDPVTSSGDKKVTTRRWGKKRPQSTFQNKFTLLAPLYFYTLLNGFVRTKEDPSIWDEHGLLVSKFLYTLGMFAQSCGPGAHATIGPMAYDLYQLAWSFRLADHANIRQAVLFALCTAMQFLSLEHLLEVMGGNDDVVQFLAHCASSDPDECCRELARGVGSSLNALLGDERHAVISHFL